MPWGEILVFEELHDFVWHLNTCSIQRQAWLQGVRENLEATLLPLTYF